MVKVQTTEVLNTVYFNGFGNKYEKSPIGDFLLNGNVLLDEEDNTLEETDVITRITNETGKFVNHEYTQIVFLAGAGSSITGLDGKKRVGRSMKELTKLIGSTLKGKGMLSLKQLAELSKYEVTNPNSKEFNLEDLISRMGRAEEYIPEDKKADFDSAHLKIYETIQLATAYDYDKNLLSHDRIIKMLSDRVVAPNKLTIATTNYDTLFEEAATNQGFSIMDGFTYDSNPRFDADNFEWNLVKDIPNLATAELEYKKQVINLIKLHGSLTWERKDSGVYRRGKDKVVNPLMIFPSSEKYMQSYLEPYFDLFSKFQELINRPNTLLIVNGFSFGDEHISQMVHHAIMHNGGLAVMISDYNITTQSSEGWKSIEDLMNARYPVIFVKSNLNDLSNYLGGSNEY
jgi:hypothetical protein